jgi:Holliday junction resolvase RusA-like endonuclease
MRTQVCIYGEPQGKGRPRFSTVCGHAKTRTPDQTVIYENLVKTEYRNQSGVRFPDDAMLDVRVMAYYTIPKSISKKKRQAMLDHKVRPTKKPDFDNIGKVICDSLNGIAYRDDAQIVDAQVRKFYSDTPRVVVIITDIPDEK